MIPAHLLTSLASSVLSEHIPAAHHALSSYLSGSPKNQLSGAINNASIALHALSKRAEEEKHDGKFIAFACLIPALVILSGVFAGLTLGYMSLDETQLHVLSTSGTPKQREYAARIMPIRKNGHLLLVTLLLCNMIVNETLPVISDPVLGGGAQSVVVSTVLIVIFAEIIPQSLCTRYGLYIGAKMAPLVQVLIYIMAIIAWPVAKLLEFTLGPHHGIIYRKAELKELIAMHASESPLGGDLRTDTVTIIGATLDLQDKTVRQAMTPIEKVFMLSIDAKLDYDTLRKICLTGHSRIPVYEETEISVSEQIAKAAIAMDPSIVRLPSPSEKRRSLANSHSDQNTVKVIVKKVIGILLVKQCVLLDPEDAVPVRRMRLNKVPFVPQNESLLGILDRFQEGRSHIAIVSRLSIERAQSVKKAVKKNLTERLLGAVRGDSSDSSEDSGDEDDEKKTADGSISAKDKLAGDNDASSGKDDDGEKVTDKVSKWSRKGRLGRSRRRKSAKDATEGEDLEMGDVKAERNRDASKIDRSSKFDLEQSMPADAVLSKDNAEEYLRMQGVDAAIMPLGIITLEDVLEELIGEEIYDEFDVEGTGLHSHSFVPPGAHPDLTLSKSLVKKNSAPELTASSSEKAAHAVGPLRAPPAGSKPFSLAMPKPMALPSLKNFGFLRSRSAPPTPRDLQSGPQAGSGQNDSNVPPVPPLPSAGVSDASTPRRISDATFATVTGVLSDKISPSVATDMQHAGPGDQTSNPEGGVTPLSEVAELSSSNVLNVVDGKSQTPGVEQPVAPSRSPSLKANTNQTGFQLTPGVAPASSRSSSPAPLEAVLVDRKRRAHLAGGVLPAPGSSSSPPQSPTLNAVGKGTKGGFKSSPLSGELGTVVADELKRKRQQGKESD